MMNQIKKLKINELIIIVSLSLFVAFLNVSKVIFGALQTTKDTVYLAVGHYLFDYFVYIHHIAQGMRGHWLVDNPYTPFDQSKTFIAFGQYLLMGKLAKIFHWSPYFTFWFAVFVLTVILCLLIFYLIKKLLPNENFFLQISAWLLSVFATPFIKIANIDNQLKIVPYEYWYAPLSVFHRFGVLPHQLTSIISIIIVLLLVDRIIFRLDSLKWPQLLNRTLIIGLLLVFMLTFIPFQVINLISSFLIVSWIYFNLYLLKNNKTNIFKLIIFLGLILTIVFPTAIYIKISIQSIGSFARASIWEMAQQYYPRFWEFIAVSGPILIFIPFGIRAFFKSTIPLKFLLFFFTIISYIYFYSPLAVFFGSHNGRFINPIVYVLFGVLAVLGIKTVAGTKKPVLLTGLLAVFLGYFLIVTLVIYRSLPGIDVFSYLPKGLITGIKVIDQQPDNKAVLTSPMLPLGVIVPVVVDRKVYLGNFLATPDYDNKTVIVHEFYEGLMSNERAKRLFEENNIGYAILSSLEMNKFGNYKVGALEAYSFLKRIYQNKDIIIFQKK